MIHQLTIFVNQVLEYILLYLIITVHAQWVFLIPQLAMEESFSSFLGKVNSNCRIDIISYCGVILEIAVINVSCEEFKII